MKKIILALLFLTTTNCLLAQTTTGTTPVKVPALDKSPMDMAYFPANYPVLKIQDKALTPLIARVIYSRPQKGGRTVFGELVEYGKVWRLGANEATEVEFFRDVKIGNKKVIKGKYTLYALVNTADWTFILNKETDIWGAFKYDEKKDVVRVTVPVQKVSEAAEAFSIMFDKTTAGMDLIVAWDDLKVSLPVSVSLPTSTAAIK
ncbi:MAG TPA: DUF2911 domain-containing protein [Flavisolibacter sp.]|jgi:hypothetical protein|nr:DUF2911 domain-containing protein [Flavisolibacter sp.]